MRAVTPTFQSCECVIRNSNHDTQQSGSRHVCCQATNKAAQARHNTQAVEVAGRTAHAVHHHGRPHPKRAAITRSFPAWR